LNDESLGGPDNATEVIRVLDPEGRHKRGVRNPSNNLFPENVQIQLIMCLQS